LSPQAAAVVFAIAEAVNNSMPNKTPELGFVHGKKMGKPTSDDILRHGTRIGLPVEECQKFFNYYESNGWRVGKNPMKSWTAAMVNWRTNWQGNSGNAGPANGNSGTHLTGAQLVFKQKALERLETRLQVIRGKFPLAKGSAIEVEFTTLKAERAVIMTQLGLKA